MIITLGIAVKCLFRLAIMTVTLVTIAAGVLLASDLLRRMPMHPSSSWTDLSSQYPSRCLKLYSWLDPVAIRLQVLELNFQDDPAEIVKSMALSENIWSSCSRRRLDRIESTPASNLCVITIASLAFQPPTWRVMGRFKYVKNEDSWSYCMAYRGCYSNL